MATGSGESLQVRFPGQYLDSETGLHYNRFRYFDPSVGRYINADPIGQYAGTNVYRYSLNNPTNVGDPLGLLDTVTTGCANGSPSACAAAGMTMAEAAAAQGALTGLAMSSDEGEEVPDEEECKQDKRLTKGEIKKMKEAGIDPHDLKPKKEGSKSDLFKDPKGNVKVKPKDGSGPGEPTGININNL